MTRQLALALFAWSGAALAALAYCAAALAWCWNHLGPVLWPAAPRVQAWFVVCLLLVRGLLRGREPEKDVPPSEKLKEIKKLVWSEVIGTSLSWFFVWLLIRLFSAR